MKEFARHPSWLKVPMPGGPNYLGVRQALRTAELHTVCEEAHCPNIGECWERQSATFMILGDICTRACRYCAVNSGRPKGLDKEEPARLARTVDHLGLKYVGITSVNRDDLQDGGAAIFADCITQIRKLDTACQVEVLIPDFQGNKDSLRAVLAAGPCVLNHNIETVTRIFPSVRAKGDYQLSLRLLARSKEIAPTIPTKSGFMGGLGERFEEIIDLMTDLRASGVDLLTIGQYLRPSKDHIPMERYYSPSEFRVLAEEGEAMGFSSVAAGPLVRSSYRADEQRAAVRIPAPS